MKKLIAFVIFCCVTSPLCAKAVENEMIFRAMQDEMKRTLTELRLPNEVKPYYVAYRLQVQNAFSRKASLGVLYPFSAEEISAPSLSASILLKVGNDQENNTGFVETHYGYGLATKASSTAANSYEGIRQALWLASNEEYLTAIEQLKQKRAYKRKKNMKETLPDVIPSAQGTFIRDIPDWQLPEATYLEDWVKKVSSWGKEKSFLEDFSVVIGQGQTDNYYLNSRGGKSQVSQQLYWVRIAAEFRQPDGYQELEGQRIYLRNFSKEELQRAEQKIHDFLDALQKLYGAKEAEAYLGPVLYKPAPAARLLSNWLLDDLQNTAPFLVGDSDEDTFASPWRKKIGRRLISPGITIYDRPQEEFYEGIALALFNKIDWEGVPTEDLVLVADGRLQTLPFSQRPLKKGHRSNGHAVLTEMGDVRESPTNVFVEPTQIFSDAEMEAKLLARCKELNLEYCYIKQSAPNLLERIYTKDGHKEYVVGLKEVNMSARVLRDILAVGGKPELYDRHIVIPSMLVDEVELEPQDRKPGRKPLIPKPE